MTNAEMAKRRRGDDDEAALSPPPLKRKIPATTSASKVAAFFTPTSQKPPEQTTWREIKESMLIATHTPANKAKDEEPMKRRRIAAFDLDGTIISTLSGKVFSKDASDWKWWHACVPGELQRLHREGYQVIFFTNQGSINLRSDGKTPKSDRARTNLFKSKVTAILNKLDLPITAYAATERDRNRKPRSGMWEEMLDDYDLNEAETPDLQGSFFVGDAAGRKHDGDGMGKKDFATSDRDFAANIGVGGIAFHTPEEYFLKQEARPFERAFDSAQYVVEDSVAVQYEKVNDVDVVVLCGSPGAGKSTFYWNVLKPLGYERVNQDILKTRDKCLKVAAQMLQDGKPVAVDNTNADTATRAVWIRLATEHKVPVRCVHLDADDKLCEHNDTVRALAGAGMNPESRSLLPKVAFTGFVSRFEAPRSEEGFQDVTVIPFRFAGTEEQKALWTRYWV